MEIARNPSNLFLGVTIDEKFKFNLHISQICKKVSKSIGVLNRLRTSLSSSSMRTLYFALIYPYLSYCNLIWGNTYISHLNPLILLQKKAIRIINNKPFDAHTNELFYSSGIIKLMDINKLNLSAFMYKNKNNLSFMRDSSHNTRNQNSLLPAFQRLTISQQSVNYSGPLLWNSIPVSIKESPSLSIFKKRYKKHLIDGYLNGQSLGRVLIYTSSEIERSFFFTGESFIFIFFYCLFLVLHSADIVFYSSSSLLFRIWQFSL